MADYTTVNVLTTVTNLTSGLTGTGYKTILVENGGANAIYVSRDPAVTTNTGHKVTASDGWRSFPFDGPLYAIAATASQDGTSRNHTIVWGSYQ
jgi:hypothetical protein